MTISEIKKVLANSEKIGFQLPDGGFVPGHFHVTEIGKLVKDFIDCGGTVRHEERACFQLWQADDYDHRLHPEKLVRIIELAQNKLNIGDIEVEVEYQGDTIEKYNLDYNGKHFLLISTETDCLAKDKCNIPTEKVKFNLAGMTIGGCNPESGCC